MATSTSNGIAAAIRYCKRWGVRVIRSGYAFMQACGELTYESPLASNYLRVDRSFNVRRFSTGKEEWAARHSVIDHTFGTIFWPKDGTDPYVLLHELSHLLCDNDPTESVDEDREHTAFTWASVRWLVKTKAPGISLAEYLQWENESYDRVLAAGESVADKAERWFPTIVDADLFRHDGSPTFRPWQRKGWAERLTRASDKAEAPSHRVVLP